MNSSRGSESWVEFTGNAGRRARPARTAHGLVCVFVCSYFSRVTSACANGGTDRVLGGLVAGETLPAIARLRGDFERFIPGRTGDGWSARGRGAPSRPSLASAASVSDSSADGPATAGAGGGPCTTFAAAPPSRGPATPTLSS